MLFLYYLFGRNLGRKLSFYGFSVRISFFFSSFFFLSSFILSVSRHGWIALVYTLDYTGAFALQVGATWYSASQTWEDTGISTQFAFSFPPCSIRSK